MVPSSRASYRLRRLGADAFEPEVGVLGAEVAGALQGGVGQLPQRQREEVGIDLAHVHDPNPVILSLPDKRTTRRVAR